MNSKNKISRDISIWTHVLGQGEICQGPEAIWSWIGYYFPSNPLMRVAKRRTDCKYLSYSWNLRGVLIGKYSSTHVNNEGVWLFFYVANASFRFFIWFVHLQLQVFFIFVEDFVIKLSFKVDELPVFLFLFC